MKGVIAAGDPQTAAAGAAILKIGGNAVDAAVAATFASFVAEAVLVSIGGGGVAIIVDGRGDRPGHSYSGKATAYDFFSTMPSGQLGDDADNPRYIKTVVGEGYCLAAQHSRDGER